MTNARDPFSSKSSLVVVDDVNVRRSEPSFRAGTASRKWLSRSRDRETVRKINAGEREPRGFVQSISFLTRFDTTHCYVFTTAIASTSLHMTPRYFAIAVLCRAGVSRETAFFHLHVSSTQVPGAQA